MEMTQPASNLAVQIVAPVGRDASLLVEFLSESEIYAEALHVPLETLSVDHLNTMGVLLVAEEALSPTVIERLGASLAQQPPWSDLPFLLLVASGRETAAEIIKTKERLPLGHITILERPLRPASLLSAVRTALRARQRQYEVRIVNQDLRDAYAALRMSEQQSRLILESTHDCIKLLDLDGHILSINEEGRKRLGITDYGKVCGASWFAFWKPMDSASARVAVASARAGTVGSFEGFYETASGEATWWDISVTPVRDDAGEIVQLLAVSREVTHRKRTEQALIQSEKLAAVGRLVSTISHEINNPLEAVTNLIYIAMNAENLPAEVEDTLALADEELRRASQIVGQTLRFHRQSTRPKRTTPEEVVSSVIALYRGRLANSNVTTEIKHRAGASLVCFEGEIRQVLSNLVGNAIDAMRHGGRLRIRSGRCTNPESGKRQVVITVADSGHGMDAATARRIFEAFYSTKGDNGTGLGLWITKGIVEKHHGNLTLRSRVGDKSGTVFRLVLPDQIVA